MGLHDADKLFLGSIPEVYDTHLVPLIFESYAADLASRLADRRPRRVLEIAAGTGALTRAMDAMLPRDASIVASDLNPAMIEHAAARGTRRSVEWRQADAQNPPLDDGGFDAVVCQFGAMFFADKHKAFSEVRRVLAPRGVFLFNVWDRIEDNEFAETVTLALATAFADSPPLFLARTPHGYHDPATILRDLAAGGYDVSRASLDTVVARSCAANGRIPALAYCQGTPLRSEIEARAPDGLSRATEVAAKAIERQFGSGAVDSKIQAHVFMIERD